MPWRRLLVRWMMIAGFAHGAMTFGENAAASPEYNIKASFLFNFAKFVKWPRDVASQQDQSIRIAIIGENHFGDALDALTKRKIRGMPVDYLHIPNPDFPDLESVRECEVAFLALETESQTRKAIETADGAAVLTVGERKDFLALGGMIAFFIKDGRVKFSINIEAADRARIKINSSLLKLSQKLEE